MKKLILLSFVSLLSTHTFASLDENEKCSIEIQRHLEIVEETNKKFIEYSSLKNVELSSYQITQFEHMLTSRVNHLKSLQEVECDQKAVRELVIQSDMLDLSKIVFSDFKLRRVVSVLNKFKKAQFKNLKSTYRKYTMTETLVENLDLAKAENKEEEISKLKLNLDLVDIKPMTTISDIAVKSLKGAIGALAIAWGKLSDATIWREGHLKNNAEVYELLKNKLKPFDLIYESRNYTLSHYTIPGHWGHVAVWMGTKDELQALGLWEQDFMKPFRENIEAGKNIIEIRKPGVQFVDLHDFINLDEIAVTRIKGIESNAENIFKGLLEQFGKKYDYAFDAHTTNKVTCAELVSFSYGDINWPMKAAASVVNLRPDDIAMYGVLNPDKAEFVAFLVGNDDFKTFTTKSEEDFKNLFK